MSTETTPNANSSNVGKIKRFFESGPHGRKVEMSEFKALTAQDKLELGVMIDALPPESF